MYETHKVAQEVDFANPRDQMKNLMESGKGTELLAKAQAAHMNGMESFPPFAAGVLAALYAGVEPAKISQLASLHLLARLGFNVAYMATTSQAGGFLRTLCR